MDVLVVALLDLLIWVFPGMRRAADEWRETASPVYLLVAILFASLGLILTLVALGAFLR